MLTIGFKRSSYDSYVYMRPVNDGSLIYLLLYVDDMLVAVRSKLEVAKIKEQLSAEFDMKNLDATKRILGMEIKAISFTGGLYTKSSGEVLHAESKISFSTSCYTLQVIIISITNYK